MLIVGLCRMQGFAAPDGLRNPPQRQIDLDLGLGACAGSDTRRDRRQPPVRRLRVKAKPRTGGQDIQAGIATRPSRRQGIGGLIFTRRLQ